MCGRERGKKQAEGRSVHTMPRHRPISLSLSSLFGACHFPMLPLDLAVTSVPLGASAGVPASVNTVTSTSEKMQDMESEVCVYLH